MSYKQQSFGPVMTAIIPAAECVIHEAAMTATETSQHLRLKYTLRGHRQILILCASNIVEMTAELTIHLGLDIKEAIRLVNTAAGGN